MHLPDHIAEPAKSLGDAASLATVFATLVGWLPQATAFLSFVWVLIRIYETKTVQGWVRRRRER